MSKPRASPESHRHGRRASPTTANHSTHPIQSPQGVNDRCDELRSSQQTNRLAGRYPTPGPLLLLVPLLATPRNIQQPHRHLNRLLPLAVRISAQRRLEYPTLQSRLLHRLPSRTIDPQLTSLDRPLGHRPRHAATDRHQAELNLALAKTERQRSSLVQVDLRPTLRSLGLCPSHSSKSPRHTHRHHAPACRRVTAASIIV